MISQDKDQAAQIANQIVEASLKLEDIAHDY
jgi:hypothetical protein